MSKYLVSDQWELWPRMFPAVGNLVYFCTLETLSSPFVNQQCFALRLQSWKNENQGLLWIKTTTNSIQSHPIPNEFWPIQSAPEEIDWSRLLPKEFSLPNEFRIILLTPETTNPALSQRNSNQSCLPWSNSDFWKLYDQSHSHLKEFWPILPALEGILTNPAC